MSDPVMSLEEISREVSRIAVVLAQLAEAEALAKLVQGPKIRITARLVRSIIKARRLRADYFGGNLGDAGWNMMLELLVARLEERRLTPTGLCTASAVPSTTASRWTDILCDNGIFVRETDPERGRRIFVNLTEEAAGLMCDYLSAAIRVSPFPL
jgi:hypothetical protein